ncbi:MAG: MBOAT family protein [Gemmatimonadaceae bacterium]|nr:MBOAT family protein [Gemmatimonadaceae bacterium]
MLFSSLAYLIVFLPLAVLMYRTLRRRGKTTQAQIFLVIASAIFYAWGDTRFLPVLFGSIACNWILTRGMSTWPARRKVIFSLGLILNVGVLCAYKYVGFFTESLRDIGVPVPLLRNDEFPLGLSFFTLQQIMYLVDCYEGLVVPGSLLSHASFVAFFPYLLLGPLSRAKQMIGSLSTPGVEPTPFASGLFLLIVGLAKKVIVADTLASFVTAGYTGNHAWSSLEAWTFSVAYSLQLYFDFSGYSEMALGAARMLGLEIPQNFNVPFRSRTVAEFWQRWHMSLTAFITTYLFTPILRSMGRATLATAAMASMLSMLVAGLWHGPSWTFVVFGGLHGLALVVNQYWKRMKRKVPPVPATILTLLFVNGAFIVFRAPDMPIALDHLLSLVPFRGVSMEHLSSARVTFDPFGWWLMLVCAAVASVSGPSAAEIAKTALVSRRYRALLFLATVVSAVIICSGSTEGQFVYAQF